MNDLKITKLIFAGGGTGGHFFPAVAIADRVKELLEGKVNLEIHFVGTKRGIEYRLKDKLNYPLHLINIRGIARSLTLKNLLVPLIIIGALFRSFSLLKEIKPAMVIGTGGYVCWPILKAAGWKKIRTRLQEQNSFPGVTIRQLAPKAEKIYLGFESAQNYMHTKGEIIVSGNPVRSDISEGNRDESIAHYKLDPNKKTILIVGGSQGARAINNAVLKSLNKNSLDSKNYQVLWQTGKRDYKDVTVEAGTRVKGDSLFPFENNMARLYAAADLIIARSGALTLAEIAECEIPALLIPFPYAAGDHQRKNADDFKSRGLAETIDEKILFEHDILKEAQSILESEKYLNMKKAFADEKMNKKKAVDIIAEDIADSLLKAGV